MVGERGVGGLVFGVELVVDVDGVREMMDLLE